MRALFSPLVSIMLRLSNEQKVPLLGVLFTLPLAILYYNVHEHVSIGTGLWLLGMLLFALYVLASLLHPGRRGPAPDHGRLQAAHRRRPDGARSTAGAWRPLRPVRCACLQRDERQSWPRWSATCARRRQRGGHPSQIAQGNQNLSQRTEEQASRWRKRPRWSTALDGKQNADNARQAIALAGRLRGGAQGRRRGAPRWSTPWARIDGRNRSPTSSA